ncbi:MAG: carbonic anhydrase family protein [Phycisphaeraceae bacterium]|nr:carbonic anhydrase family protein [Phycisphaeraceae bacterium]MCW5761781.1 carbonic anhydrase family protein [Phycisphaeraceae bacterium]
MLWSSRIHWTIAALGVWTAGALGQQLEPQPDLSGCPCTWPDVDTRAGGHQFSPINIADNLLVYPRSLPALTFIYPMADLLVHDPGGAHTGVQANKIGFVHVPNVPDPVIPGAVLIIGGVTYELVQFHFHVRSEHKRNGNDYAMEMHLVHRKQGGTNLVVVGRWIEPVSGGMFHQELDKIFGMGQLYDNALPMPCRLPFNELGFDLSTLLPAMPPLAPHPATFRYHGSLTAVGDQATKVDWIIFEDTMGLSHAQINEMWNYLNNCPPAARQGSNATAPFALKPVWPPFKVSTDIMPGPKTDVNGDGSIDFFDALVFLGWWSLSNERADWNGDYSVDFFDLADYLNDFAAGL